MGRNIIKNNLNRDTVVDALKGIAIICVVLDHSDDRWSCYKWFVSDIGYLAVALFFVISGCLTWGSISKNNRSELKWFFKRYTKIMFEWYIAIILSVILSGGLQQFLNAKGIYLLLMNILFLNGIAGSIIPFSWYFGELSLLYIFTIIVYKLSIIKNLKSSILCCAGFYSVCFIIEKIINIQDASRDIFLYIPIYMLGIIIYYVFEEIKDVDIFYVRVLIIMAIIFLIGEIRHLNSIWLLKEGRIRYAIVLGIMLICFHYYCPKIIKNKLFQELGKNSLYIYLYHGFIIDYMHKYIDKIGVLYPLVQVVLTIGICIVVSYLFDKLHIFINRKFIKNKLL